MNPTRNNPQSCKVAGCEDPGYYTRGLCKRHYARLRRTGETGVADKMHSVSYDGKICSIDGCEKRPKSRGYCVAHYHRFRRWGDPLGSAPKKTPEERFESSIDKTEDCWEWRGTIYNTGYGRFMVKKKQYLAHRWAYEHYVGPIPNGMVIDHICRNRLCVNPDHMEVVTNEENLSRGLGFRIMNGMDDSCIHGHKYTSENTYWAPNGRTARCRTCARERDRKRAA